MNVPGLSRHPADYLALFAGLLFIALGVGFGLDGLEVWDADVSWVPPIALIALGLGGALATMAPTRQSRREAVDPPE